MSSHTHSPKFFLPVFLLIQAQCVSDPLTDFEARLELYRNEKLSGEMRLEFTALDGRWTMLCETKGS